MDHYTPRVVFLLDGSEDVIDYREHVGVGVVHAPGEEVEVGGDGEGNGVGGAHLGGATAGGEDGADADVLDEVGVDAGAGDDSLEGTDHEVSGLGVLELALSALAEGCAEACCDDDLDRGKGLVSLVAFSWDVYRQG